MPGVFKAFSRGYTHVMNEGIRATPNQEVQRNSIATKALTYLTCGQPGLILSTTYGPHSSTRRTLSI